MPNDLKTRRPPTRYIALSWQDCDALLEMIRELDIKELTPAELMAKQKLESIRLQQLQIHEYKQMEAAQRDKESAEPEVKFPL